MIHHLVGTCKITFENNQSNKIFVNTCYHKKALGKEKIKSIIQQAIQNGTISKDSTAISIQVDKKNRIAYAGTAYAFSNRNFRGIEYIPATSKESAVALEILALDERTPVIELSEQPFAKRSTDDIVSSWLQNKRPLKVIYWLCMLVVAIKRLIKGIEESVSLKSDPYGKFALEDSMREVVSLLPEGGESEKLRHSLQSGIVLAEVWRTKNKKERDQAFKAAAANITQDNSLTLPAGMWRDGKYRPMLVTFSKNEQNQFTVTTLQYGTGNSSKTYVFDEAPKDLGLVFADVMDCTRKPVPKPTPKPRTEPLYPENPDKMTIGKFFSLVLGIQRQQMRQKIEAARGPERPPAEDLLKVLTDAGGKIEKGISDESKNIKRQILREDPLKLIQEMIRHQFPEATFSDKAIFSLGILNHRMKNVLNNLGDLSAAQRYKWLHKLERDYRSLERQLRKSQTPTGYFLSIFSGHLDKLRSEIRKLEKSSLKTQAKRMQALNKNVAKPIAVGITKTPLIKIDAAKNIDAADRSAIISLSQAMQTGDIDATLKNLKALSAKVDGLVAAKQYSTAIQLYRDTMAMVQTPSTLANDFYHGLENLHGVNPHSRIEQIKELSAAMGKMGKCLWESKLRVGDPSMQRDEWVDMLVGEAALVRLIKAQQRVIQEIPEGERSVDQVIFTKIAPNIPFCHSILAITGLEENRYLRVFENSDLRKRFNMARTFLKENCRDEPEKPSEMNVRYDDAFTARNELAKAAQKKPLIPEFNDRKMEVYDPATEHFVMDCEWARKGHDVMQKVAGKKDAIPASDEESSKWTETERAKYVPAEFRQLSYLQLIFNSLVTPDSMIGRLGESEESRIRDYYVRDRADQQKAESNLQELQETLKQLDSNARLDVRLHQGSRHKPTWVIAAGDGTDQQSFVQITPCAYTLFQREPYAFQEKPFTIDLERTIPKLSTNREAMGSPGESYDLYCGMGQSEATAINRALAAPGQAPMDAIRRTPLLIKTTGYERGRDQFHQIHLHSFIEVVEELLLDPGILDRPGKNSRDEDVLETHQRIYQVLFHTTLYAPRGDENDSYLIFNSNKFNDFFLNQPYRLKKLLEQCKEKHPSRYQFLLYVTHTIDQLGKRYWKAGKHEYREPGHDLREKPLFNMSWEDVGWPNMHTKDRSGISNVSYALEAWGKEKDPQTQIDGAAYIVSMFSNSDAFLTPETNLLLEDPTVIAKLMQMGSLLEIAYSSATIPAVAEQARLWIRQTLVPYINSQPELRNVVFNQWLANTDKQKLSESEWSAVEGGENYLWTNGTATVDLNAVQMLKGKQRGVSILIPKEIQRHPDYQSVFGNQVFHCIAIPAQTSGEMRFEFTDPQGNNKFRMVYNQASKRLTIDRETQINHAKPSEKRWLSFSPIHSKTKRDASAIESLLIQRGVWIDPHKPTEGIAFFNGKVMDKGTDNQFRIDLNTKGIVSSVKTFNGKLEVVNDPGENLQQALSCLPAEQMFFMRPTGSKAVTEIRFLNQKIGLQRESVNKYWVVTGDDTLQGAEWVMGENRGDAANRHLQTLGHIEQIGFTVRQNGDTYLVVWPQKIEGIGVHKEAFFEFDKRPQSCPPLKIKLGDQITSSSTGYLYLAYLYAQKHKYEEAASFLERARGAQLVNPQFEGASPDSPFIQIQQFFSEIPVTSARSAAVKLKALLAIRTITREQIGQTQYDRIKWRAFLKSALEVHELHLQYQKFIKEAPFSAKAAHAQTEKIALTEGDLRELDHINRECLFDILALNETEATDEMADPEKVVQALEKDAIVSLEKLKAKLAEGIFGPTVSPIVADLLSQNEIINQLASYQGKVPFNVLMNIVSTNTNIHLMEVVRSVEISERIAALKQQLAKRESTPIDFAVNDAQVVLSVEETRSTLPENFETLWSEAETASYLKNIEAMKERISRKVNSPHLTAGLETAANKKAEAVKERTTIHPNQLVTVRSELEKQISHHRDASRQARANLLEHVVGRVSSIFSPEIQKAIAHYTEHHEGDADIVHLLTQAYQKMKLKDEQTANLLTTYLLHQAAAQVLSTEVMRNLSILETLKDQVGPNDNEWIAAATKLKTLMTRALNFGRYVDPSSQKLKCGSLYRKILVMEAQKGIIVTDAQINLITKMVQNPNDWYELKVGLGKTSVVFVIVLMLLTEQGEFPTALLTSELEYQHAGELSASTRSLAETAGTRFSLRTEESLTSTKLQEQYHNLLAVKADRGFTSSTIDSFAALKHQPQLIDDRIAGKMQLLESICKKTPELVEPLADFMKGKSSKFIQFLHSQKDSQDAKELLAAVRDIEECRKCLYYLDEINQLLSHLRIDEADSIMSVTTENNVGRGKKVELDPTIRDTMGHVIRMIRLIKETMGHVTRIIRLANQTPNGPANPLVQIVTALAEKRPLEQEWIKKTALPTLARSLLKDHEFQKAINGSNSDEEIESLVAYLTQEFESNEKIFKIPKGINTQVLDTIKTLLQSSILNEFSHPLAEIANALADKRPHGLDRTWVKQVAMPSLARSLLKDRDFQEAIKGPKDNGEIEGLIAYLTQEFEVPEKAPKIPKGIDLQVLGAIKTLLQSTIPNELAQNPGISTGIKRSDGFQVGPRIGSKDKQNMVYSDQFVIIASHYLWYSNQLPEEFATTGIIYIQDNKPNIYAEWEKNANEQKLTILQYLNLPENYSERLKFLDIAIIVPKRIRQSEREIVLNHHDITKGRKYGGMTGTRNKNILPATSSVKEDEDVQEVNAQVLLEAGILGIPKVDSVAEANILSEMQNRVKMNENKAIINQGFDLENGNTANVVRKLREAAPNRIFVYRDSDDGEYRIWRIGTETPEIISKEALKGMSLNKEFREKACMYFGPNDIRGLDLPIPAGTLQAFISPKCTPDDDIQLKGRGRGAGEIHRMDIVVSEGVRKRIRGEKKPKELALKYEEIVEDIAKQGQNAEQGQILKTNIQGMKGVMTMGSRDMAFGNRPNAVDYDKQSFQERWLDVYVSREFASFASNPKLGLLEEMRGVNLEAQAFATTSRPTEQLMFSIFESEKEKIQALRNFIKDLELPKEGLMGALLKDQNDHLALRKKELLELLVKREEELTDYYEKVVQPKLKTEVFPKTVPSSGAALPTTEAHVHEVEIQKMEAFNIQEMQNISAPRPRPVKEIPVIDMVYGVDPSLSMLFTEETAKSHGAKAAELQKIAAFWGRENFRVSQNFHQVFKEFGGIRGNYNMARLYYSFVGERIPGNNERLDRNKRIVIINKDDMRSHGSDAAIYALMNPEIYGEDSSFSLDHSGDWGDFTDARKEESSKQEEFYRDAVHAKWFLGMAEYNEREKKELIRWFQEIKKDPERVEGLKAHIRLYGSPEQLQLWSVLSEESAEPPALSHPLSLI